MGIESKIAKLPDAKRIPARWKNMQAAKESRHPNTEWKVNPLKVIKHTPAAIELFKQFPKSLRSRMFAKLAVKKEFNPKELVTYQPVVSSLTISAFAKDPKLANKHKAYILMCEEGPVIWNSNHRAVAALLVDRPHKAMCLDLTGNGIPDSVLWKGKK